jgi:hypothetical protein
MAGLSFGSIVVADEAAQSPSLPAPKTNRMASVATVGQPENRWRYRYSNGRWWYWTRDNQWSYFDGNRWTAHRPTGGFLSQKVDPALLRLEAKEGTLGYKRWQHSGGGAAIGQGGGGWAISGTRGSLGGAPTGSWTFSPSTPNELNTNPPRKVVAPPARMGGGRTGR